MTITVPATQDEVRAGAPPADPTPRAGRFRGLWRGRRDDQAWVRPALLALLAGTALLYLWNLSASGWGNSFYAAAVEAGTKSWKAFFFGSFDSASFITVDKPPASLWVMDLSARVFGLGSWSVLGPQALEGVAAVGLLYLTVRRRFSAPAALLAGAVMALTPVAVLMFRFDNPDALLVLLLVASAYAVVRALERAGTWWLVLAAALVGTGFLTKMLQAFIVVPVFAAVYLLAAPTPLRRRLLQLLAAGGALLVASGWWVAIVSLVPATARPYIGGSQTNSVLELVLGYNGFGRLTGNESGSVGGGAAGTAGRWGATGLGRLFGTDMGGEVSWLLPAALVSLGALLWLLRKAPRTDQRRAQVLLWGGWLLLTGVVFSYAQGIIHPYYTVALAPAIGALVGVGAAWGWRLRRLPWVRALAAVTLLATAWWAYVLLDRTPDWYPALRYAVVLLAVVAAVGIMAAPRMALPRPALRGVAVIALVSVLAGPTAYSLQTAADVHTGAIPSAGPALSGAGFLGGGPGGRTGTGQAGGPGGFTPPQGRVGGFGGFVPPQGTAGASPRGGVGGLLDAQAPSSALVALLRQDASAYTWVAATVGANSAAGVQLGADEPVLAIGGFNGTDPAPTLAEFQALVAQGRIHYFLGSGRGGVAGGGPGGGSGTSSEITTWVEQTFTAQTVGGTTVYDLTAPTGSAGSAATSSATATI